MDIKRKVFSKVSVDGELRLFSTTEVQKEFGNKENKAKKNAWLDKIGEDFDNGFASKSDISLRKIGRIRSAQSGRDYISEKERQLFPTIGRKKTHSEKIIRDLKDSPKPKLPGRTDGLDKEKQATILKKASNWIKENPKKSIGLGLGVLGAGGTVLALKNKKEKSKEKEKTYADSEQEQKSPNKLKTAAYLGAGVLGTGIAANKGLLGKTAQKTVGKGLLSTGNTLVDVSKGISTVGGNSNIAKKVASGLSSLATKTQNAGLNSIYKNIGK